MKGFAEAVEVYEVAGMGPARTRLEAGARRGLTQLTGRDVELAQLHHLQKLAADGHGQVVAIVGEAGVGKSRLVYEFTHSHRLQSWRILESAAVSYGKASSYLLVIDLLKTYFQIEDRDDLDEIRKKVTSRMLALDESLRATLPALLALLDVPVEDASWATLDPAERRRRTLDAVRRLLLREARERPLLVIFEDLHWIDSETQAVLDTLVDSLGSAHLLLLVNYRPEYKHPWGSKTYYAQVRLDALPTESAGGLLDFLLGDDPGLIPLKQLLVKRGNPFFLEETVRTLVETKALTGERGRYRLTQPVQAILVPATVQAILAARIDRLAPGDKRLLQVASVVGKDVPSVLLHAIADLPDQTLRRGLDHLQAAEFLDQTRLFPDIEYSFKHALTHDVAYGGLLQERRRELHARIVSAIETLHGHRLGGEIERLAYHAVRGEMREKAIHYLRQAGLKAAARSAPQEARARFEQALAILEALPETLSTIEQAFDIRLELRPVLTQLGEARRMLEILREAEVLAGQLNDDRRRGRVCAQMTNIHSILGQLDEALAYGIRALAIAHDLGDLDSRILTTTYLATAHYRRGEYERVVELAIGNLATVPAARVHDYFGNAAPASVFDRYLLVTSLAQLGRFVEAADYEAEAIRLAEPTHHPLTIGLAHIAAGSLHLIKGDWAKARSLIERWIAGVQEGNVVLLLPFAFAASAWELAQRGEAGEAVNRLREAHRLLDHFKTTGYVGALPWAYLAAGRACLLLGRLDDARELSNHVIESFPLQRGFAAHAMHLLGDIATHPDRFDAEIGEVHYRKALALAEPRGMRPLVAHCHLGLGTLYRHTGKRQEAQEHLTTATTMYREMDLRFWLEKAEAERRVLE